MRTYENTPVVWRKSSRSFAGNECVEVALAHAPGEDRVLLRDSKLDDAAPLLQSSLPMWRGLIAGVKSQRYSH